MDPQAQVGTPSAPPPPPPGYSADQIVPAQAAAAPPPPPGYTADQIVPSTTANAPTGPPRTGFDTLDMLRQRNILSDQDIGVLRGAAKTYTGLGDIIGKVFHGSQPTQFFQKAHDFANQAPANMGEGAGEAAENLGELFSGEELLGMVGKAAKGAEALKDAGEISSLVAKHPFVGRLLKIGQAAVKQGALAAGQTAVKTGGDTGAAGTAGLETGLATGALNAATEGLGAGVKTALTPKPFEETAAAKGSKAYGEQAGQAIKPNLEAINAATGEPKIRMEAGPGGVQGEPAGMTNPVPKIDIDKSLRQVGDYRAARTELQSQLNKVTEHINQVTDGRFSELKNELENAPSETSEDKAAYKQKLDEMDSLIENTVGSANPEMRDAMRAGWRQYFAMGKVTKTLDKSLNGIPGVTENLSINGNKLLTGLRNARIDFDQATLEAAVGGSDRLRALNDIGEATKTNAGRKVFNSAIQRVAEWIPIIAGGSVARHAGLPWEAGAIGGAAASAATGKVYRAVLANPKVAQNLLYAIDHARPEVYGPFIANMIQTNETQASRERQQEQQK